MMVRRYIVKEMPEAVVMIRRELGKDAVILSTKRITVKKWFGLWRSRLVEVMAATGDDIPMRLHHHGKRIPDEVEGAEAHKVEAVAMPPVAQLTATASESRVAEPDRVGNAATAETADAVTVKEAERAAAVPPTDAPAALDDVRQQLADMKKLLENNLVPGEQRHSPLIKRLLRQGFAEEQVKALLQGIEEPVTNTAGTGSDGVQPSWNQLFTEAVLRKLEGLKEAQPIAATSRVVALVGPTGVGKTTSIAKLAALNVLAGQRKVGLITTDTFRIAAVEQLKTYANILNIPLRVVYQPAELVQAVESLSDCDLILMDTAGRNFRMDIHVREIQQLLEGVHVDETILVLSTTSKAEDLDMVTRVFNDLPIDKFLFTKLDETTTYGHILNLMMTHKKPLSYVTTGQNVPDDIEVGAVEKILRLILGGAA